MKSRAIANVIFQRAHSDKVDPTSPTPDFCALKCVAALAANKSRDTATVCMPVFFLQTEENEEDKHLTIKLTGTVYLLLVECDERKWKKHLRMENIKLICHAVCNKIMHETLNAALMAYKKLAKALKEWYVAMSPCDPCMWNSEEMKKRLNLLFHVDDVLLAHAQPQSARN